MQYPDDFIAIARDAVEKHPNDIKEAVSWADVRIRKLPSFDNVREAMISGMVQELIYQQRHVINVQRRNDEWRESGKVGNRAAINTLESPGVRRAFDSLFNHFIGGRTLGHLLGSELDSIAESEAQRADGHNFNALLCRKLKPLVPNDKRVSDVVSERKLKAIWKAAEKEAHGQGEMAEAGD